MSNKNKMKILKILPTLTIYQYNYMKSFML